MADVYGVFEGGGVKGIALVGALARIEREGRIQFLGYGGTSAGALVAALAAVGYPASDEHNRILGRPDLQSIMMELDFRQTFLGGEQVMKLEELLSLDQIVRPALSEMLIDLRSITNDLMKCRTGLHPIVWCRLLKAFRAFAERYKNQMESLPLASRIFEVLRTEKGVYSTQAFATWLKQQLEGGPKASKPLTFEGLKNNGVILKVVAASLKHRAARLYGPAANRDHAVVDAVRHSISIPLFFRPCQETDNYMVDGGIVSNFPAWIFDSERKERPAPILGFRLVQDEHSTAQELTRVDPPFGKFGAYVAALFTTVLEGAQEIVSDRAQNMAIISIKVPKEFNAYRFDLGREQREQLWNKGYESAHNALSDANFRQVIGL